MTFNIMEGRSPCRPNNFARGTQPVPPFTIAERSTLLDRANPQPATLNRHEPDFAQRIPISRHNFLLGAIECPKNGVAKRATVLDSATVEQQRISRNSSISGGITSASSQ